MLRPRVIPILLMDGGRLVKGIGFSNHSYVGDPMNAVRIFNDKNADELFLVDIGRSRSGEGPDPEFVRMVAEESFMPFGVGGGIQRIEQIRLLLRSGAEKVLLNSIAFEKPDIIREASNVFGRQAITVGIDFRRGWFGRYSVYSRCGERKEGRALVEWAVAVERLGAGEILLSSVDRDGCMGGYDLDAVALVTRAVSIPVIVMGGAGKYEDLVTGIQAGASAAAAGSLFVFHGTKRSVLINYPEHSFLEGLGDLKPA